MTIKVLACGEASFLSSGYAIYMRNLLSELSKKSDLEIAEFGIYADVADKRHQGSWKFFGNNPVGEAENKIYSAHPTNEFGGFRFEETLLKFKPDVVFDIRDHWHFLHEANSPFRRHFKWLVLPAVDAEPQNPDWIATYVKADGVLTYTDWNGKLLQKQSNGKINWLGAAPNAPESDFIAITNRDELKKVGGLEQYPYIIGNVMRNQARKLYPDLFESFANFLKKTGREDVYLWCHTSYPDGNGWDFPFYLQEYSIGHKVLFTYQCLTCGDVKPKRFTDAFSMCDRCNNPTSTMTNPSIGIDSRVLAQIYNCFDLYVQYANSEGLGMPVVEASACGVPVMSVDYSAMSDIVRKVDGTPIKVKGFYHEIATNCKRAVPDNNDLTEQLIKFFNTPKAIHESKRPARALKTRKDFSWEKTADIWYNAIQSVAKKPSVPWNAQPMIRTINNTPPENLTNGQFAEWLIVSVLQEPERLGSYFHSKLIRDLNYGFMKLDNAGLYFNEFISVNHAQHYQDFKREDAFKMIANIAHNRNLWEERRVQSCS